MTNLTLLALLAAGSGLAGSTRLAGQTLLAPRARLRDNRGHGHGRVVVECAVVRCFCHLVLRIKEFGYRP